MAIGVTQDSVRLLREAGLRVTPQRLAVLEALGGQSHPTADDIYRAVTAHFPGVGLATVYNTLAVLQEHDRVRVVEDRSGRRFDLRTEPHQHIRCRGCGAIEDLPHWDDRTWLVEVTPPGWAVEHWTFMAEGLCPACR
jgi:Fur family peroxide stress response transcriptional regulator